MFIAALLLLGKLWSLEILNWKLVLDVYPLCKRIVNFVIHLKRSSQESWRGHWLEACKELRVRRTRRHLLPVYNGSRWSKNVPILPASCGLRFGMWGSSQLDEIRALLLFFLHNQRSWIVYTSIYTQGDVGLLLLYIQSKMTV